MTTCVTKSLSKLPVFSHHRGDYAIYLAAGKELGATLQAPTSRTPRTGNVSHEQPPGIRTPQHVGAPGPAPKTSEWYYVVELLTHNCSHHTVVGWNPHNSPADMTSEPSIKHAETYQA